MKKFLIIALMIYLIMPSLALPDVYDQLRGRQMVGDKGAPWFADDASMKFGTGKDVSISYDDAMDKWYVNDTDVYLEEDVTIAGNLGVSGTTISNGKTTDPFYVNDLFYVSGLSALNATSATDIVASAIIRGEHLISSDDARIADDLIVNDLVVNATTDINGAATTAAITVDSGSIVTADQFKRRTSTTATNTTILDGGPDVYLVGNGTGVNTQTITFPTAADNKGRVITVILATDPLTNTVILDGENSEEIDGATTKTTTDAVGSMYHLICNGVGWIKLTSVGSWS